MPKSADIEIRGFKHLDKQLSKLGDKVARKVSGKAMTEARRVVVKAIKARTPKGHGDLRKSIGGKRIKRNKAGFTMDIIGARSKKRTLNGKPINPAHYAHLVEFGTTPHAQFLDVSRLVGARGPIWQAVQHPGAKAKPFMRPGFQASYGAALRAFRKEYARGVAAAAKTARGK